MSVPASFKGLRLPVVAAPMFLVSGPRLVTECRKAGIVGTFPALNQRTTEGFEQWVTEIAEIQDGRAAPYGVNLIVHKSNPRLEADLKICIKHKVPLIITSLGAVAELVEQVHSYGGLVFHDVTNLKHAKKAAGAGVDGLIAVCAGAGGHAGRINPFALVGQIRQFFGKTLLLAGALSRGADILAAQAMGADLAYMGTRFIATEESGAQPEYKQMILDAQAEDIVYTPAVSGVPANFMRASLEKAGFKNFNDRGEVDFGDKLTLDGEEKAWKNIWSAGHGVSNVADIPKTRDLVDRLEAEYRQARASLVELSPRDPGEMSRQFEIVPLKTGGHTVRSLDTRETFHPTIGPAAEARLLHIESQRIRERSAAMHEFQVWDVGFGAAANALAALEELGLPRSGRAELHSFDLTTEPIEFALAHTRELEYLQGHEAMIRELLRAGMVEVSESLTWRLHLGDFRTTLKDPLSDSKEGSPLAILYDPYSPARNASMWTLEVFRSLFSRLNPAVPALLTTYTRSTAVRASLLLAGFSVGRGRPIGEKSETTVASNRVELLLDPLDQAWLKRVRASGSAAPLRDETGYSQSAISEVELELLKSCAQFSV